LIGQNDPNPLDIKKTETLLKWGSTCTLKGSPAHRLSRGFRVRGSGFRFGFGFGFGWVWDQGGGEACSDWVRVRVRVRVKG
jgi:hypothetical protein